MTAPGRRTEWRVATVVMLAAAALLALAARTHWTTPAVLGVAAIAAVAAGCPILVWRPNLSIEVTADRYRVQRGESVPLRINLSNTSRRTTSALTVSIAAAGRVRNIAVGRLAPGSAGSAGDELGALPRGVHRIGPARVVRTDLFGMFRVSQPIGSATEVIVHPHLLAVSEIAPRGPAPTSDDGATRVVGGSDFDWIRPWRPGDDLRRVHWLTSARTGTTMVRTFTDAVSPPATVVLEVSPQAYVDDDDFECAVDLAATCCAHLLRSGTPITLSTTDGAAWRMRPSGGEIEMLDVLACVSCNQLAADAPAYLDAVRLTCFVTGSTPWANASIARAGSDVRVLRPHSGLGPDRAGASARRAG